MASPPVISAPTLVTSTNQVATATPTSAAGMTCIATPPTSPPKNDNDNWHFKYMEAKGNYRKLKAQMRDQAKKSRQLIVAVKNKLQEEENEKIKVNKHFDNFFIFSCRIKEVVLVVPYGFFWFLMVPFGSLWFLMVPYDSLWFLMGP